MKVLQRHKTLKAAGSRASNRLKANPRVFQGTNGCPIAPGGGYLAGHWFNPCKGAFITLDGEVESTIGQRSGIAFPGRGYKGDGIGYIDLSSIAGVVTAKVSFEKDDLGNLNANNLTYSDYKNRVEPTISVTVNGSKHLVIPNGYTYHGIAIYEDGVLYDFLTCEEGAGAVAYGIVMQVRYPITSILPSVIHVEEPNVPFSFLNEKGYNSLAGAEIQSFYPTHFEIISSNFIRGVVTNDNGNLVRFNHLAGNSSVILPYVLDKYGWHDGKYYLTTENGTSSGNQIFNFSGSYSSFVVELKARSLNLTTITIEGRDTSRWTELKNIATTNGYDFSRYDSNSTGQELYYVITGTDPTHGDNYPNSVGFAGLTSTTVQSWLTGIFDDSTAFVNAMVTDYAATPWNNRGSYIFTGTIYHTLVPYGTEYIDVKYAAIDAVFSGSLTNAPGKSYFNGNTNEPVINLSSVLMRRTSAIAEFIIEKLKISDTPLVPASTNNKDAKGITLEQSGRVKLKAQLVDAPCFESNGVAEIDFGQTVTKVTVNGVDITNEIGFNGSLGQVNLGVKLYNMVVNDTDHYPVNDDGLLTISSSNGGPQLTISNAIADDVWSTQDDYHYQAFGDGKQRSVAVDFKGKVKFPEVPEMFATDTDPLLSYSAAQLIARETSNSFVGSDDNILSNLLVYNLVTPGLYPCYDLTATEEITFVDTTNWHSISWQGDGDFTLDQPNNKIVCNTSGCLYNLKVFNSNGDLIAWFPVSDGEGQYIADVMNAPAVGTLPGSTEWMKQTNFDYNGVYGAGRPKAFSPRYGDSFTTDSNLPVNLVRLDTFTTDEGETYKVSLTEDSNGDLATDPDGYPVGWTIINGKKVLNIYNDFSQSNINQIAGGNLLTPNGLYPSAIFKMKIEVKENDVSNLSGRDAIMATRFKDEFFNRYGKTSNDYFNTVEDFFNAINGGVNTIGPYPNGTNPNYPNTHLGMNTANGFPIDVTRADLIDILDNHVFTNQGTAALFLEGLVTDGVNTDTAGSNRWTYTLTRAFNVSIGNGSSYYDIELTTENFTANAALSNLGNTFIANYENKLELYSNMKFTYNYGTGNTAIWIRIEQFTIDEISEAKPAKYVGRLSRSSETVAGGIIDNTNELANKGQLTFKALKHTNSSI